MPLNSATIKSILEYKWGIHSGLNVVPPMYSGALSDFINDFADLFQPPSNYAQLFEVLHALENQVTPLNSYLASLLFPNDRWRSTMGTPTSALNNILPYMHRSSLFRGSDAPRWLDGEQAARNSCPFYIPNGYVCMTVTVQDRNPVTGHSFFEILGSSPHEYIVRGYDVAHSRGVEYGWGHTPKSFYFPPIPGNFHTICAQLMRERLIPGIVNESIISGVPTSLCNPFLRDAQAIFDGYFGKNHHLNQSKEGALLIETYSNRLNPQSNRRMLISTADILERKGWNLSRFAATGCTHLLNTHHSAAYGEARRVYNEVKQFFNDNPELFLEWYYNNTPDGQNLKHTWYEENISRRLHLYRHDTQGKFAISKYGMLGHNCADAVFFALRTCRYTSSHPKVTNPNDVYGTAQNLLKEKVSELLNSPHGLPQFCKKTFSRTEEENDRITQFYSKLVLLKVYYLSGKVDIIKWVHVKSDLKERIAAIDTLLGASSVQALIDQARSYTDHSHRYLRSFGGRKSKLLLVLEEFLAQIDAHTPNTQSENPL